MVEKEFNLNEQSNLDCTHPRPTNPKNIHLLLADRNMSFVHVLLMPHEKLSQAHIWCISNNVAEN